MSVNKVILIGNNAKDPEVRFSTDGTAFANLSLATSEKWKDKQTGEQKEKTEWHSLVFSGRLAEVVGEYVTKGSKLYVEGALQTRKWTDQQGQDKYTTEIKVFKMEMLSSKQQSAQQNAQQAPQQQGGFQQPSQQLAQKRQQQQGGFQQQQAPQQQGGYAQQGQQGGFSQQGQQQAPKVNPQEPTIDFDDDIPF